MKQILMVPPINFQVAYEINPWMTGNVANVDKFKAAQQWSELRNALSTVADVIVLPTPPANCPDAVFAANAGLIYKDTFICSEFKHAERQVEEPYFLDYFKSRTFDCISRDGAVQSFEGAGDALFSHDRKHLWFGFGFRSSLSYKAKLDHIFDAYEETIVRPVRLRDPHFYHLDTCFCPLDTGELLWYPGAFDDYSQDVIRSFYCDKMIEIQEPDAERFACNAVSVGSTLVLPQITGFLSRQLSSRGYDVIEVDMSQFLLSGGACKCLTLECVQPL